MIELVCDKNRAFFRETEKLTSGSIGVTINFVFSPEWDGLLKTAVFEAGDVKNDVVLTADSCEIPPDVLVCPGKQLFVGVFGELADKTLVIPTIYAAAGIIRPGASPSGMTSAPPYPSWPEQVQAIAFEAKEVADSVRSDADAGEFNGPPGDPGGWYTPAVTQPDSSTMRVSFSPSREGMPEVDPADITLPIGGTGLTSAEKTAMLTLFKAAAYTANVSGTITSLETLWGGGGESGGGDSGGDTGGGDSGGDTGTTYSVTNNLTNVTNSNSDTTATGFYSATLTVVDGYFLESVVITMGGVDITDSVYGDGGILITEVTGDIVITATAKTALAYQLPEVLTFNGADNAVYDTGYAMYPDGDKTQSVCIELSVSSAIYANVYLVTSVEHGYRLWSNGALIWRIKTCGGDVVTEVSGTFSNVRIVYRRKKNGSHSVFALKDDVVTKYTGATYGYYPSASEATVKIGPKDSNGNITTSWKGSVNDFRAYDQYLTDAQVEAYLRGEEF